MGVNTLLEADGVVLTGHEGCQMNTTRGCRMFLLQPRFGPACCGASESAHKGNSTLLSRDRVGVSELKGVGLLGCVGSLPRCSRRVVIAGYNNISVVHPGAALSDWRKGLVIPIYKYRIDRKHCRNYYGVILLSVPGKQGLHASLA